jgi:hypothetical protein
VSVLMVQVCVLTVNPLCTPLEGGLHFHEPKVYVFLSSDGDDKHMEGWYLDTGTMSHLTRRAEAFSELNRMVQGTMWFGWRWIAGVTLLCSPPKKGERINLAGVLLIPCLNKNNIVSLGQLDENACKVLIEKGALHA